MEFVQCTNAVIMVEFDCYQLVNPNHSSMVVNCLREQLLLEPALEMNTLGFANYAIL